MRKRLMLFASLIILASAIYGCGTFQQAIYQTLYVSGSTYDLAMKSVRMLQDQGKISIDQRAQINKYGNVYYESYLAAVNAFEVYKKNPTATNKELLEKLIEQAQKDWPNIAKAINAIKPGTTPDVLPKK